MAMDTLFELQYKAIAEFKRFFYLLETNSIVSIIMCDGSRVHGSTT